MKKETSKTQKSKEAKEKPASKTLKVKEKEKERPRPEINKKLNEHIKTFKDLLLNKKITLSKHLKTELRELEAPDKHHLADLEEMASDTHDTDSVCEIMAVGVNTIDQINLALAKIEEGTYGICEDCESAITFERLEALPFATLCIQCKKKREVIRS